MKKMFCPKCKSINVDKEVDGLIGIGAPQNWKCDDCGYSNFIFPQRVKLIKDEKL